MLTPKDVAVAAVRGILNNEREVSILPGMVFGARLFSLAPYWYQHFHRDYIRQEASFLVSETAWCGDIYLKRRIKTFCSWWKKQNLFNILRTSTHRWRWRSCGWSWLSPHQLLVLMTYDNINEAFVYKHLPAWPLMRSLVTCWLRAKRLTLAQEPESNQFERHSRFLRFFCLRSSPQKSPNHVRILFTSEITSWEEGDNCTSPETHGCSCSLWLSASWTAAAAFFLLPKANWNTAPTAVCRFCLAKLVSNVAAICFKDFRSDLMSILLSLSVQLALNARFETTLALQAEIFAKQSEFVVFKVLEVSKQHKHGKQLRKVRYGRSESVKRRNV